MYNCTKIKNLNHSSKECTTLQKNKDPRYTKIIKQVQGMNTVVIHDISISGEGPYGIFSILTELTFLRLCIENDLYHPHLYRWNVGVSVGTIIITMLLNTRYLYECYSKEIALEYLKAIEDFIDFDNMRAIFLNLGENKTLGDFEPRLLLKNLMIDGCICSREALVQLIKAKHPNFKFNNKNNYFSKKNGYYDWLNSNNNLNNVFFVCYSLGKTQMRVFTGNEKRFTKGTNYITYLKLTPENLISAILASSAITILYPQPFIGSDGDQAIDGASAEISQLVHLQILINVSFFFPDNVLFTPILLFFGITPESNNNFLIFVNKKNSQYKYEDLLEFGVYKNPLINSISSFFTQNARITYNAQTNVPLTAVYLSQPFIQELSTNDITDNILKVLKKKNNILTKNLPLIRNSNKKVRRFPSMKLTETQFNTVGDPYCVQSEYKTYEKYNKMYEKYIAVSSNTIISSHLYGYSQDSIINLLDENFKEQVGENGKKIQLNLNILYIDQFVRCAYQTTENYLLDLLTNNDTGFSDAIKGMGYISGNAVFDSHLIKSFYTASKENLKDEYFKNIANNVLPIVTLATKNFVGESQTF